MGSIFGGGKSGGFQAQGPSQKQVKTSYNQSQDSIAQQKDFVNQLQAQNGLGNQQDVFQQQQALANQLQGVANGTGPNPAQAQLAQATGANVSNQAALMAGQRGASANTGMIARQAGMQGGAAQQQAAGQAATLQAQQQIAAMQQLQGQQANMAGLASQQAGQTQQGLNSYGQMAGGQYATITGQQTQANNMNMQMAQQRAAAENNMMGNLLGAAGTVVGGIYGGPAGAAAGGAIGSSIGSGMGGSSSSGTQGTGGAANGDWASLPGATGGEVHKDGFNTPLPSKYRSKAAQHMMMAEGGKVPLLLSPGEVKLSPQQAQAVAQGAKPMAMGKEVPGKAKVGGAKNSYSNDTVKDSAEPGSIILPRSVTQSKNPDKAAAEFVAAVLKRQPLRKK